MFKYFKKKQSIEDKLYNKILSLSRNKLFYTKLDLKDSFQNRINLIFLHISFSEFTWPLNSNKHTRSTKRIDPHGPEIPKASQVEILLFLSGGWGEGEGDWGEEEDEDVKKEEGPIIDAEVVEEKADR